MLSKVHILFFFLLFSSFNYLISDELYLLAQNSDRSDNPYLIGILKNSGLDEGINIIKGLCVRNDFYIADILIYLATPDNKDNYINEHLLMSAIYIVYNESYNNQMLLDRIDTNRIALDYLFNNITKFRNSRLKSLLINLLQYYKPAGFESILFTELNILINYLFLNKDNDPEINIELLSILNIIKSLHNYAFIEPLSMILKLSDEKTIIENTRIILKTQLSQDYSKR